MIGEQFDFDLTKDGDRFLIYGRCGEDGIIGGAIAKHWQSVKVFDYSGDYNDYCSDVYQNDINPNFGPNKIRKDGTIYITLSGHNNEIDPSRFPLFDWALEVRTSNGVFAPYILYSKGG
jgi:hypothetical protein